MKRLGFILMALACLSLHPLPKKGFTITLLIDKEMRDTDQWVYLSNLYFNEYTFIDSCKIEKGDSCAVLRGYTSNPNDYTFGFSKIGPRDMPIVVSPEEQMIIPVKEKMKYTDLPFYPANAEYYQVFFDGWDVYRKKEKITDKIINLDDPQSNEAEKLRDSIKYYDNYIVKHRKEQFEKAEFETTVGLILNIIEPDITDEEFVEMLQSAKKRFPYSERIDLMYNYTINKIPYPPASENSRKVSKRINDILESRFQIPKAAIVPKNNKQVIENTVVAYRIGDIVEDKFQQCLSNDSVSIKDITTPYILIDVWASWCIPCRKEATYLRKVQRKYGDYITIVAVSIDDDLKAWQQAITIDGTTSLKQICVGSTKTELGNYFQRKLDIKFIPANFLLDKDRKIIATNLRGENLEKKIKELIENK